ncbi:MAG: hypothetical protein J7J25_01380 [Candidatus Omnitrophica bacterium]|nr:hypothetical protein [Candidatus Omnitrophota bacterium]
MAMALIVVAVVAYFIFNIYLSQSNTANYTPKDDSALELEYSRNNLGLITKTKAKTKEINQKLKHREQEIEKALH